MRRSHDVWVLGDSLLWWAPEGEDGPPEQEQPYRKCCTYNATHITHPGYVPCNTAHPLY
jgi:hypothetical protein